MYVLVLFMDVWLSCGSTPTFAVDIYDTSKVLYQ
jgi:hypothetical protein